MSCKRWMVAGLGTLLAVTVPVGQAWARQSVGKAGDWKSTIAATGLGTKLYTVESSGALYVTDTSTGVWKAIGRSGLAGTALLVGVGARLATIDSDGSLYVVEPATGARRRSGTPGDWKGTIAAAGLGEKLCTVERSGVLYVTDIDTGTWRAVGKPDFAGTQFLLAAGSGLYSIEKDGSLYAIDSATGAWKRVGTQGAWKNTIAATAAAGTIYTVESSGTLYATDPASGTWKAVGKPDLAGTRFLAAVGTQLAAIDAEGSLSNIDRSAGGSARTAEADRPAAPPAAAGAKERTFPSGTVPAGEVVKAILGDWVGDPDTMMADPAFKVIGAGNQQMFEGLLGMLRSMRVNVTADAFVMEAMGEKSPAMRYRVVSTAANKLRIESLDADKKKATFVFLDRTHIKLADDENEAKATFLKRP